MAIRGEQKYYTLLWKIKEYSQKLKARLKIRVKLGKDCRYLQTSELTLVLRETQ